jgi:hypothetical protein
MHRRWLIVSSILGILLTACDGSSPDHSSSSVDVVPACCVTRNTQVSGALVGIGGPVGAATQHWAGTVRVEGPVVTTFHTDDRGHFSEDLPIGTYRFSATSPSYDGGKGECRASRPVRLGSHHTAHVRIICQLK